MPDCRLGYMITLAVSRAKLRGVLPWEGWKGGSRGTV
jgi:hypothetical protein